MELDFLNYRQAQTCMSVINFEWSPIDLVTVCIPIQLLEKLFCITNKQRRRKSQRLLERQRTVVHQTKESLQQLLFLQEIIRSFQICGFRTKIQMCCSFNMVTSLCLTAWLSSR